MPPIISTYLFLIDAEPFDNVDSLKHEFDLRPALDLENSVTAKSYEGMV